MEVWLYKSDPKMIYELSTHPQVLYVVSITSILGILAFVLVGNNGTILLSMCHDKPDFSCAICDLKKGAGNGNRLWYINSTALKWATRGDTPVAQNPMFIAQLKS